MCTVRYENHQAQRIAVECGRVLEFGSGSFVGQASLASYWDPPRVEVNGVTLLKVSFIDSDGRGFQYQSILSPLAFWPRRGQVVRLDPQRPTSWDHLFMATLNSQEEFEVTVEGVPPVRGRFQYQNFSAMMKIVEDGVSVWASWITNHPAATRGTICVRYEVPIRDLLWRRAPRLTENTIEYEAEPFIMLDDWKPTVDLPRSPIRVLPAPVPSGVRSVVIPRGITEPPAVETLNRNPREDQRSIVTIVPSTDARIACKNDRALVLTPGQMIGYVDLKDAQDPDNCDVECATRLAFTFLDADGRGWRYWTVLHPLAFFPRSERARVDLRRPDASHYAISTLLDSREDFSILLEGHDPITGRLKYTGFDACIDPTERGLSVWARFTAQHPTAVDGHVSIRFELPGPSVLWRTAPKMFVGDIALESSPFIMLDECEPPEGLPRSPASVHPV